MIITVAMQKGGTGKTTTAAALAQAGAVRGARVLAVDIDPQANLTYALGAYSTKGANSYNLFLKEPASAQIQKTAQGVHVIPASWDLSTVTSAKGSARRLQDALRLIKKEYDLIIIDTPPTAGELQYNALQAADSLVIPLQADMYNIQSLAQTAAAAQAIIQSNPNLKPAGILLTQYNGTTDISRQMFRAIINRAVLDMKLPYLGAVRAGDQIREAAALQKSLYDYAPKSAPAKDYMDIFHYLTGYQFTESKEEHEKPKKQKKRKAQELQEV